MSVHDQNLGSDVIQLGESIVEQETTFEEPITIRRFSSQPATPGALGTPQKIIFTDFPASAVVVEQGVAKSLVAAEVLSAGDLVLQMRDRLTESNENIGGAVPADRVLYRGMEYRMVQRPQAVVFGGDSFYIVVLRRTNPQTDTVGL